MEKKLKNEILFFDESNMLRDIKKLNDPSIITFDHKSHTLLKNKQIKHQISDEFLDVETSKKITTRNYELLKWCELNTIKEKLTFHGVNIPKLFTDELISNLLIFLKKVIEVKNFLKRFPDSEIHASNELYDISKIFKISVIKIEQKVENEKLYFDEIRTSFTICNKQIGFKISNKKYQKIKRFFDIFFNILNFDLTTKNNSTLILELNTEQFDNLLIKSKENNISISYYGRRRPAIWNKNTFNIIRKSKCKIITTKNLSENNHKFQIDKNTKDYLKIFDEVLNQKILNDFFNIFDICIWPIVRKKFKNIIEPHLEFVIEEILLGENLFKKFKPKTIIMISEAGKSEQIISSLAKNYDDVEILHLQEGPHCDTVEAFENTYAQGVYPILADKYIVWGDTYEQDAIEIGKVQKSKIEVLGSPRFDNLQFNLNKNEEKYVLLATMPPQTESVFGLNTKNLENYKKSIIEICDIVTKMNKKMKIKLHPAIEILNLSNIIKEKFPKIEVIYQGDINPLIRNCSELIVTGLSTVIFQGQILKKPVISVPLIEYYWGEPSVYKTKSCIISNIDKLEHILHQLTIDSQYRSDIIKNGDKFVESCLKHRGTASQKIWEYIKNKNNDKYGII